MNFASTHYLVFITVVFFVYWHLGRRAQNIFILAASYFFYANWDWRFLSLIVVSTLVNYLSGPRILSAGSPGAKKAWLALGIAVNLGVLGYFKYFNFFAEGFTALAEAAGWHASSSTLRIILPVGISFYTFQSMSYTIDIYRGRLKPAASLVDFAAFVAFFPQLVAGPIVRASEFLYQLDTRRRFSGEDLQEGLVRFLYGLFKKLFIADTLAVYLVDPVFADPAAYSSGALWLALIGYTVQIYADFSGYSSMAIGSARILGFRLPENFDFPYLARSFSEFWRRWHMTMSRFFRDYVYISLGGNRTGTLRTLRNLAATTLLSGLWHGAGLNFVLWGALHGAYITGNHFFRRAGRDAGGGGLPGVLASWLLTQLLVCLAWVLFRSQGTGDALLYFRGLIGGGTETVSVDTLVWLAFGAFVAEHAYGWVKERLPTASLAFPPYARALLYAAMIVFLYHARIESANPFIYFQF